MPTIKPGSIIKYILNGKKELLTEAAELVQTATTHEEASLNLRTLQCEQQSHALITNGGRTYLFKGLFGGGVAGMTRSLIQSEGSVLSGIAAGAALGGSAALLVDRVEDCLVKSHTAKRNEEVSQLIIAAHIKLTSLMPAEEKKNTETSTLRKA